MAACDRAVVVEGGAKPDAVLLSWGSSVEACREAAARLRAKGKRVRTVAVRLLWPFPRDAVRAALGDKVPIFVVEANALGQMARLLKSELPVHDRVRSVLQYDGRPIASDAILEAVAGHAPPVPPHQAASNGGEAA